MIIQAGALASPLVELVPNQLRPAFFGGTVLSGNLPRVQCLHVFSQPNSQRADLSTHKSMLGLTLWYSRPDTWFSDASFHSRGRRRVVLHGPIAS